MVRWGTRFFHNPPLQRARLCLRTQPFSWPTKPRPAVNWQRMSRLDKREEDASGSSDPKGAPLFERITFTPEIMGRRACIRGMRITVAVIVGQIAHGASFEEILEGYPDLERADVEQAVEYAAWLTHEEICNA